MKFLTVLFFVCTSLLLLNNCDSTDPKIEPEPELLLKIEGVSCTEAWLQLKATNLQLPNNVTLFINDLQKRTFNLTEADTLLYVDSLLPNQNYFFQIISFYNPEDGIKSNKVNAQTLDTTSHNFTWQTVTFGEAGTDGSVIFDIAIVNENNIWAVGEIYMNDSLGNPDPKRYNAVKWNGSNWTVIRIPYNYQGADFYNPIQSVFAFSQNDIWFCGNGVIHWNGNNFVPLPIPANVWGSFQMNKIWGSSSNDLYVVGNEGSIAHYDGSQWTRLESGTTLNIYDIWGNYNNKTQAWEILCVASTLDINNGKEVLQISGTAVNKINNVGLPWSLRSVWFIPERKYYTSGDGLYSTRLLGKTWIRDNDMPPYYKTNIRGSNINDVVMVGAFGLIMHFNGIFWHNFQDITYITGSYNKVIIKENLVACSGGLNSGQAIITIGRR